MHTTWSKLSKEQQKEIVALYSYNSRYDIAKKYNLHPDSLRRKIGTILKFPNFYPHIDTSKLGSQENIKPQVDNISSTKIEDLLYKLQDHTSIPIGRSIDISQPIESRIAFLPDNREYSCLMFTDLHCPYQDQYAIDAMYRVIEKLEHNVLINGGDNLDLYGLSSFGKDNKNLFINNFEKEVTTHNEIMYEIGLKSKNSVKISLYGNHMQRWDRWIEMQPFVSQSHAFSIESILSLAKYGWQPFVGSIMFGEKYDPMFPSPNLIIEHGISVKKGASNSALDASRKYGLVSYVQGHVHRLGVHYQRTLSGQIVLAECGTMRNLDPDYVKYPDWQHGMLHISVNKNNISITPIFIHNGKAKILNATI